MNKKTIFFVFFTGTILSMNLTINTSDKKKTKTFIRKKTPSPPLGPPPPKAMRTAKKKKTLLASKVDPTKINVQETIEHIARLELKVRALEQILNQLKKPKVSAKRKARKRRKLKMPHPPKESWEDARKRLIEEYKDARRKSLESLEDIEYSEEITNRLLSHLFERVPRPKHIMYLSNIRKIINGERFGTLEKEDEFFRTLASLSDESTDLSGLYTIPT